MRAWIVMLAAALAAPVWAQQPQPPAQEQSPGVEQADRTEAVTRAVPRSREQLLLSYAPLVKAAAPAVVNIYTRRLVPARESMMALMFREFFGDDLPQQQRQRVLSSLGSGVLVRADGVVVTNNHVINGADSITIALQDRREFDAEVVVADPRTDLAVLRIDTGGEVLPYLDFADSDQVEVGDIVLAMGNPFGLNHTVTSGIVSATARTRVGISDLSFFIQTDAAINPGNSGGALIDLEGRLMGINTAIFSRSGSSSGLGFAIPAVMVRSVVSAALNEGQIVRPWLGISGQSVNRDLAVGLGLDRPGGVLIDQVYPGGPADQAGIQTGDVILAVDGREVVDEAALGYRVATAETDLPVTLSLLRDDATQSIDVTLALPPEDPPRDITELEGRHPFQSVTVANLSPRFNEELGLDPLKTGVAVLRVERRSPAGRLNWVRPGDVLLAVNEQYVTTVDELEAALEQSALPFSYRMERSNQLLDCLIASGGRRFGCQPAR
ncbi:MAG: Do family serine endopeptidase [Rhodothalassiaceae bacterium]